MPNFQSGAHGYKGSPKEWKPFPSVSLEMALGVQGDNK